MQRMWIGLVLAACGSGSGSGATPHADALVADTAGADAPTGFTLTSPAFAAAGAIPMANSCKGADTSPALAWTNAPSNTQSFAVVLTDLSLTPKLIHWVIYDIPSTATGLPAGVEKAYMPANVLGASQTPAYDNATRGYLGPCPPSAHMYQFAVYPILATTLPGGMMTTTRDDAFNLITAHELTPPATLTGTFTP